MAFTTNANYHVITLSGTKTLGNLGNGITASTVHQIYCLETGVINITPMMGEAFNWSATTNSSIDIVPSNIIVSSGSFIGIKAKFFPLQNSNLI